MLRTYALRRARHLFAPASNSNLRGLCSSPGPRAAHDADTFEAGTGRDLAKLALLASATRNAISICARERNCTPELLVSLEADVNEAVEIVKGALDKVGRPCSVDQLGDRVNRNVVSIPPFALGYRQLLRAGFLRDSLENSMQLLNVMPPVESAIDGSGKPFSRTARRAQRRKEEEERQRSLEVATRGQETPTVVVPSELRPVSSAELARRKVALENTTKLDNVLRGFDTALLEISRVHKVTKGGTTMSMRALVVIGNRRGAAGYGEGKSDSAAHAIERACRDAKRNLLQLDLHQGRTVYHRTVGSYVKSRVSLWPATAGSGISANNNFSAAFQLFGIKDIGAKLHGPRSQTNAIKALFNALSRVNTPEGIAEARGLQIATFPQQHKQRLMRRSSQSA